MDCTLHTPTFNCIPLGWRGGRRSGKREERDGWQAMSPGGPLHGLHSAVCGVRPGRTGRSQTAVGLRGPRESLTELKRFCSEKMGSSYSSAPKQANYYI